MLNVSGWNFNLFPSVFQHPFVTQPLNRSLAIELLDKMNNPDHSTYHDFDDDDPEVGICFSHRIRLGFCLPAKRNNCDFLSPRTFWDLGIVSRVAFTVICTALSRIQVLSKNHYIFAKRNSKRALNTSKFCLLVFFNNFEIVNVVCFSSPEFCHAFCRMFLCGVTFPSAKKTFLKMILYLYSRERSCSCFCQMV